MTSPVLSSSSFSSAKHGERWLMEKTLPSKPEITIQNVVATGSLKHGIDIEAIVKAL